MPAFRVKLGANDLNCVNVLLNPTHSLSTKFNWLELWPAELTTRRFHLPAGIASR